MDDFFNPIWFAIGIIGGLGVVLLIRVIELQEHIRQLRKLFDMQNQIINVMRKSIYGSNWDARTDSQVCPSCGGSLPIHRLGCPVSPPPEDQDVYDKGAKS
jgi:hypothetical protein